MNPIQAIAELWHYALLVPIEYLLTHLHDGFSSFTVSRVVGAFGLAVIVVTVLIRAALIPLFTWQLRTSRRTQAEQAIIAPQLAELRKKYRKEPQKLNAETMQLYKEHGISPFSGLAGCLPLLVQYPILIALYQGIRGVTSTLHSDLGFLWVGDVTKTAADVCCTTAQHVNKAHQVVSVDHGNYVVGALTHPAVLILPLLSAFATFVQSKMMMPRVTGPMSDQQKQAMQLSRQMSYLMPPFIFFIGMAFPQGIALYWVTQSLFMIVQQYFIVGWGSLPVPEWFPGAGRVTPYSRTPAAPATRAALTDGREGRDRARAGASTPVAAPGAAGSRQGNGRAPGVGQRRPVGAARAGGRPSGSRGARRKRR